MILYLVWKTRIYGIAGFPSESLKPPNFHEFIRIIYVFFGFITLFAIQPFSHLDKIKSILFST